MSLSIHNASPGNSLSRACPAACGALIAAKDLHPFCVVCLGLKHAQEALENAENCSHCLMLPKNVLRRRLKVAATQCSELGFTDSDLGHGDDDALPGDSRGASSLVWADQPNPAFPEEDIFAGNLMLADEPAGSGDEDDATLLGVSEDEDAIPPSGVPQASGHAALPQSILLEVCERAAARLNIEWPAPQSATDQERDIYDGKVLGSPPGPGKQLFPVLPACAKHMRHNWSEPLDFKHGLSGLEVKDMAAHGMGDPPAIEPSIARHLNPAQGGLLAPPKSVLPNKLDRFSASVHQAAYKSSALAVRALNVSSLLSAYQAEILDELGQQLKKRTPSLHLWKEILTVNDLVLRNARQAVQACGRSMALSVVGERVLWLNLSGLPDSEKRRIAGASMEPDRALFGPAVALMQQRCDDKRKEDEAFKLCLPKGKNRLPPRPRLEDHLTLTPSTRNVSGLPDVRLMEASSPRSWATSPSDSLPVPGPPFKRRRVSRGWIDSSSFEAAQPMCLMNGVCSPLTFRGSVVRKSAKAVSPHRIHSVPLTQPIKASAPVFPQHKTHRKTKNTLKQTNQMNSLWREDLSPQRESISPRREEICLNPCMLPLVCPLDGAIASQINQLGLHSPAAARVGTLSNHEWAWRTVSAPEWVMRTIMQGYRLQFSMKPPHFNGVLSSHTEENASHILKEEISSLLNKGAIQMVPPTLMNQGFYSRYFLVPKKDGALRPILDLRVLNKHLRKYNFRMLTHGSLARAIKQNDWFTSVDLKDAFFHISIYPPHRKFLRFAYQGTCYEFTVLPFGLSLSPRCFCLCAEAGLAPMRMSGLRILTYIDDWLIIAESKEKVLQDTCRVLTHITSLGFRVNVGKSNFTPSQNVIFLGLELNSVSMRVRLSQERVLSLMNCLSQFREGAKVQYRTCLRLQGLMASSIQVVPLGLLRMRAFMKWVLLLHFSPTRDLCRSVIVTRACSAALRHWKSADFYAHGTPLGTVMMRKVVTTDASLTGWGATQEGRTVNGLWPSRLRSAHINYLELMAIWKALNYFLPRLQGHHVLVRCDNTTTVAYINRQGGVRSSKLHALAYKLLVWSAQVFLSLRATHVPGLLNRGADLLSRGNPIYGDWRLHPQIVDMLWMRFGQATVDLFASRENYHCPMFFSLKDVDAPLGVDALAHPWPRVLLYAFPPLCLIIPTLARVREQGLSLILIAPRWPKAPWLAEIITLLYAEPWRLPPRTDLLSQANGEIYHPHPDRVALWAWPVRGRT
ncbi:uncharacterized protein LOC128030230 [Carassius gibelio]|uniref:uncharacterized protein LOC128030230 n=1 Tax=Carassius gibelio TaxID=101364 RepID=UPI0022793ECF|nr:uncharacterized protein LOC128030230 [Carassius gibelio]